MTKRLLVMAGGTGGHVFPGLAVAHSLQQQGWQVLWLGTAERMEAQVVPKHGFDIAFLDIQGVRGNGALAMLKAPFKIIHAVWQARAVIKRFKPDVVLGMGGYASGPGGVAAWLCGVPLLLHEQNAVAGMTNKLLSRFATRILTGFDNTFSNGGKVPATWVGNPIRADFIALPEKRHTHQPLRLLIVGGSLGARALNHCVPQAVSALSSVEVRHQCGRDNQQDVNQRYQALQHDNLTWQVTEFIDDMAAAYDWADLVICRAGALTVAEVAAAGVAAVFVPLPHAVDDHQTKNARSLADQDAAWVLPQDELENGGLSAILQRITEQPEILLNTGRRARALAKRDATEVVANNCQQLAEAAA